jgi:hypothetical protein
MAELCNASDHEQVVDVMVALTRPSPLDSVMITGNESMELYLSLRRRGFGRAATPATCRIPRQRHVIGLVTGPDPMAALAQASPFLSANSAVAVLIEPREAGSSMNIRHKLQQMGFRIEAGVRCQRGFVLFASRRGFSQMEQAA